MDIFDCSLLAFLDEEWSQEPVNLTQKSTPETVSVEHHEEQEVIPVNTTLEKPNNERTESDTGKKMNFQKQ